SLDRYGRVGNMARPYGPPVPLLSNNAPPRTGLAALSPPGRQGVSMTFSPRTLLSGAQLALAFAVIGLVSTACEDKHIGRPCDLVAADAGASGTGRNATINAQAVEC